MKTERTTKQISGVHVYLGAKTSCSVLGSTSWAAASRSVN